MHRRPHPHRPTIALLLAIAVGLLGSTPAFAQDGAPPQEDEKTLAAYLDPVFNRANELLAEVLFLDVSFGAFEAPKFDPKTGAPVLDPQTGEQVVETIGLPLVVMVLLFGGIFFSIFYRFISLRGFRHSVDVILGRYDDPDHPGEISHFRALTSALSATVGLGNIAGVALAVRMGGPGAVFWMWLTAVFGMASKFSSCTLAQLYRQRNPDGSISGGPMYYLDLGLGRKGGALGKLGKVLSAVFAVMVMGGALGGGNMFQSNQAFEAFSSTFGVAQSWSTGFGIVLAALVGVVVIGGIRRIGAATSRIVPAMCGIYVAACAVVLLAHASHIPATFALIFERAFTENAIFGGFVGVMVAGVKRAAFSNEAGLGSAAIAHAAAKTDEPVREGMVAMIGPFIDTILVCTMTALVVIITGTWNDPALADQGVAITVAAFEGTLSWFPTILTLCILLFAYSTMISWCYYGERGWIYLADRFRGDGTGLRTVIGFRVLFVTFVFLGAVTNLGAVLDFSDLMILSMALPNIAGSILLAPDVIGHVRDYWGRYTSGQMPRRR